MAKVQVLGGSGLLGRALARRKRAGDAVRLTHLSTPVEGSIRFDVRDGFEVPLSDADFVICALPVAKMLIDAGGDREANARRLCASFGDARPVLLSTDAVFGGTKGNYLETDPPDPMTEYGRAQALLDEVFLDTCPKGLVVRTSFLFSGRAPDFDKRLGPFLKGKSRTVDQRWPANVFRSPTEADFCAEAIWRAVETDRRGVVNICGPRMSIRDFFATALPDRSRFPLPPVYRETRTEVALDTSLDPGLMEGELNLDRMTGWDWYRKSYDAMGG